MYILRTQGNKTGPEKFVQRGRKNGNGRFFTSDIREAQSWIGFIPAKKRAEEAALQVKCTIAIIEARGEGYGKIVATVSPNLTLHMTEDGGKQSEMPMLGEEKEKVPCLYCGSPTQNDDEVCYDSRCQAIAKEKWAEANGIVN